MLCRGVFHAVILITVGASALAAQTLTVLPEASQRASVSQRIGLTDITVSYHRPLINGRKVWGDLVPWGQVWRAGANENTTITFTDPVTVEGKALAKGVYGLHMIPGPENWIVIFTKNSSAWGSFTYKQDEDALRVTVKAKPSEMHEALVYDFDDLQPDSVAVNMRWEKLAVPFHVAVDAKETTMSSLRDQLRGGLQYTWEGWAEAANYSLTNKTHLDEGLQWADKAINQEERFDTLMLKAQFLDALNRQAEAGPIKARALTMANVNQLYSFGRQLQAEKKPQEALDVFRQTVQRFPNHWLGHAALARLSSASGDFKKAVAEMNAALAAGAPENQKPAIDGYIKRLEAGQDINR